MLPVSKKMLPDTAKNRLSDIVSRVSKPLIR